MANRLDPIFPLKLLDNSRELLTCSFSSASLFFPPPLDAFALILISFFNSLLQYFHLRHPFQSRMPSSIASSIVSRLLRPASHNKFISVGKCTFASNTYVSTLKLMPSSFFLLTDVPLLAPRHLSY